MLTNCRLLVLSSFLVLLLGPVAAAQDPGHHERVSEWTPRTAFELRADFSKDPVPQIRAHLADVVADLERADVSHLTPRPRQVRAALIAELADYAAVGVFPQNELRAYPTPVFIDDAGRACAVGYLMLVSDGADLARRIARKENTAYVPEITVPGVSEWMARSGLTADECARIQPTYGPCGLAGGIWATSLCSPAAPTSAGFPAYLVGCGSNLAADNDLRLHAESLPPDTFGLFLFSRSTDHVPLAFGGQGTLCLGGTIGRLGPGPFAASQFGGCSGWCAGASLQVDLTALPTPLGAIGVQPGETWVFQAWFRDRNPSPTSNFTNALVIDFY